MDQENAVAKIDNDNTRRQKLELWKNSKCNKENKPALQDVTNKQSIPSLHIFPNKVVIKRKLDPPCIAIEIVKHGSKSSDIPIISENTLPTKAVKIQKIEVTLPKTAISNCQVSSYVSECHSTLPEHISIIDHEVHPNNTTKSELVQSVSLKSDLIVSDAAAELVKIQTEVLRHELARAKLETQQWVMENETLKFQLSLLLTNHKEISIQSQTQLSHISILRHELDSTQRAEQQLILELKCTSLDLLRFESQANSFNETNRRLSETVDALRKVTNEHRHMIVQVASVSAGSARLSAECAELRVRSTVASHRENALEFSNAVLMQEKAQMLQEFKTHVDSLKVDLQNEEVAHEHDSESNRVALGGLQQQIVGGMQASGRRIQELQRQLLLLKAENAQLMQQTDETPEEETETL